MEMLGPFLLINRVALKICMNEDSGNFSGALSNYAVINLRCCVAACCRWGESTSSE